MILSSLSPSELVRAIADKDENSLVAVKGIGTKTAQRILVDLKNKVKAVEGLTTVSTPKTPASNNAVAEEAVAALVMLGFQKAACTKGGPYDSQRFSLTCCRASDQNCSKNALSN